jgi:hypothetical protein
MIDNFDSSAQDSVYEQNVEGGLSSITLSDNTTDFVEGTGSLNCKAVIGEYHPWGSFAQLIYREDSTDVQDWSISDSLSIWIKVNTPPTHPEYMVFRFHIADRPSPEDPIEEYIYENLTVIDYQSGWFQLKVPIFEREQNVAGDLVPDSTGFILAPTTWGGFAYNNRELDRDKIVGYNIGMITSGWNPNPNIPADSIEIQYDAFVRFGTRAVPLIIFNGMEIPGNLNQWAWGGTSVGVEEGTGATAGTNSLKWTQGDPWTGFGYDITNGPLNMAGSWIQDSLKFKMKAPAGTGPVRTQFESGPNGKVGTVFQPIDDGQWHDYALPLAEFVAQDGTTEFDSSAVILVGIMAEGSGIANNVVYLDDVWTGNPDFDVIPPAAPTNVTATVVQDYLNSISWTDVPGETGETYTIYYSENPITNIEDPGVEVVAIGVPENTEFINHGLRAPVTDQSVTYYYAVGCKDEAGNKGDISDNTPPVTNMAEGVTVINPTAPPGFAADGNLSEWAGITPFRMFVSDGSGTVVTNTTIDDDADLSVNAYVAMDNDYLYIAYDVTDDQVSRWVSVNSWEVDCPDLFIGLYNWHGAPHTSYQTGPQPDYHFRFNSNQVIIDNLGQHVVFDSSNVDYYWEEKFGDPGYVVEAKISFADIAAVNGSNLFSPLVGMRIPIDHAINDADGAPREGILTYSPNNQDQSWQDVSRWLYTWIGDQWVGVEDENNVVLSYELAQNYPNPFNPVTQIQYTIEQSSNVTLRVFDILGREVATLINENQNPGRYVVDFNASNFASGIYFYRLEAGSFIQVKKMILMK